jgi:flavodoxin
MLCDIVSDMQSMLIAYFSHSGNTQAVASQIREIAGGDVFRISAVDPYPVAYDAVVEVARREQKNGSRPQLTDQVANMGSYGVVVVGYPNWWSTMPMAVFSFLEQHDLSGKKISPFCTHEGSALGRSLRDMKELCPRSVVLEGLAIRGGQVRTAAKDAAEWLRRIKLLD